jgi:hypothetical protein
MPCRPSDLLDADAISGMIVANKIRRTSLLTSCLLVTGGRGLRQLISKLRKADQIGL